ncbi:hypothetical protein MLD38_004713 [Melastoma candidum]|uniref:Uncharacterized protein n=1 Tax=Melastoma candidum TaxID=119954 RepID=A0ACB9S823_9MYRT|nr:hypothetical protein MLD38_004713 [Melastoma candidum]
MGDAVKQMLAKSIQLADQLVKALDEATSFKQDCADLKSRADRLSSLLRQAARSGSDLYDRPARRILDDASLALAKTLSLALKCRPNKRQVLLLSLLPSSSSSFRKCASLLDSSLADLLWLLRLLSPENNPSSGGGGGLPPIAANEPILCLIWEQISVLHTGSPEEKSEGAASLASLARDNERYGKLIIEEGGVGPLLRLLKEGTFPEAQENAALAISLLSRDPESVEEIIRAGAPAVLTKVLKDAPMKVQAEAARAVAEIVRGSRWKCQEVFAQHNVVRLLVGHLAFETVQEHSKYAVSGIKATSMHAVVLASSAKNEVNPSLDMEVNGKLSVVDHHEDSRLVPHPLGNDRANQIHNVVVHTMALNNAKKTSSGVVHEDGTNGNSTPARQSHNLIGTVPGHARHHSSNSISGVNLKGRELEDPATKARMKAMAARALWHLAKGNSLICRSITESRALLCFALLLEKGSEEVRYNSAMALMEITTVAEKDADLRRSAFKPNSPACKAVVEQVLMIINKADSELLVPCVKAVGNLARTFKATETRMIAPLVRLLDDRETEVSREACLALTKFACTENYLHLDHSRAILEAGGAKHLVQLVYLGEQVAQTQALTLLCYVAKHVPDSEDLARVEALTVLEWASKQGHMVQEEAMEGLLVEAKSKLELYQSRGSRGMMMFR